MTDTQRVLTIFRKSGGKLISNSSISAGQYFGTKPILNWSARITDARDEIKCNCGQDETTCTASEHIRNVKKNWYQYVGKQPEQTKEPAHVWVDVQLVQKQLADLQAKYVVADPYMKSLIEVQERALKRSIELQQSMASEVKSVMERLV